MRKRNIKTIAHWVFMCCLFLFPMAMVGISGFSKTENVYTVETTYEYETNEVNSPADLIVGNIYFLDYEYYEDEPFDLFTDFYLAKDRSLGLYSPVDLIDIYYTGDEYEIDTNDTSIISSKSFYFVYRTLSGYSYFAGLHISASDYLGAETTTVVQTGETSLRQEINNWCNMFINLPVNKWYGQLLDVVGIGNANSTVMNVIYIYPIYILWVYIIDLILDCLLLIVNMGHNALHKLGGDND